MRDASMMSGKLVSLVGFWGLLLGIFATSSAAHAQPAGGSLAVLGLETFDGAPAGVANAITDALRQRVSASKGFRLVPGKDLMEVKLVFSCPDEAPSCMAQAAKSLGADKLVFGSVKKAADGYLVTLKMLDAAKGRVDAWVAEQIGRSQATAPGIRGPVQKWFATLSGAGSSGSIRVTADIVGASVLLDGLPVGVTGNDPLELGGIATGRHDIVISKPGYEPVRKNVDVVGGEVASVEAVLGSATEPSEAPAEDGTSTGTVVAGAATPQEEGNGLKIATWATLGAGAVALALGIKFGLDVLAADKDLDPYRRWACKGAEVGAPPACDANKREVGVADAEEAKRIMDEAKTPETLQWVFYGLSAALIGTGTYLFYKAYLSDDDQAPQGNDDATKETLSLAKRLRVAPVVTPHSAGFSAGLTF